MGKKWLVVLAILALTATSAIGFLAWLGKMLEELEVEGDEY